MILWPRNAAVAGMLALISSTTFLQAQDAPQGLEIELLQLTPKTASGGAPACELLWRVLNHSGTKLSRVVYSMGIFTTDEVMFRSVPFSDIPASRSKLLKFTMENGCDSYESVLFSDLVECLDETGASAEGVCDIEKLTLSSPRTSVTFLE